MKEPMYQCAECKRAVIILNGEIIRACEHAEAGVLANLSAIVVGQSKLDKE